MLIFFQSGFLFLIILVSKWTFLLQEQNIGDKISVKKTSCICFWLHWVLIVARRPFIAIRGLWSSRNWQA